MLKENGILMIKVFVALITVVILFVCIIVNREKEEKVTINQSKLIYSINVESDSVLIEYLSERKKIQSNNCRDNHNSAIVELFEIWLANELVNPNRGIINSETYSRFSNNYVIVPNEIDIYRLSAGDYPDLMFGYNVINTDKVRLICSPQLLVKGKVFDLIGFDESDISVLDSIAKENGCNVNNDKCLKTTKMGFISKYMRLSAMHGSKGVDFYSLPRVNYIAYRFDGIEMNYYVNYKSNVSYVSKTDVFVFKNNTFVKVRSLPGIVI